MFVLPHENLGDPKLVLEIFDLGKFQTPHPGEIAAAGTIRFHGEAELSASLAS